MGVGINTDPAWKYTIRVIEKTSIINGEECLMLVDKRLCTCKKELDRNLKILKEVYPNHSLQIKERKNNKWQVIEYSS
ncbi:hypothetical protein [Fusobacterium varium]|uniref:hypothetical protein n=1 Tax=Fusobacterium varium TaxID=856 RepID=UPI003F10F7C6